MSNICLKSYKYVLKKSHWLCTLDGTFWVGFSLRSFFLAFIFGPLPWNVGYPLLTFD